MFFFNDDKSKVDAESYIAQAINNLSDTLRELINQKSNIGHTHSAADIVSGVLDIARIPGLAASKITEGVLDAARIPDLAASKITSGSFGIARGGTGATTADAARTNLGATKKRNITANYSGTTTSNPDVLVKMFTGTIVPGASSTTKDINISVSGYTPVAIMGFYKKSAAPYPAELEPVLVSTSKVTVKVIDNFGTDSHTFGFQVAYLRTAIINQ